MITILEYRKLHFFIRILLLPSFIFINGCIIQDPGLASVDIAWYQAEGADVHIVQPGESLYAIAFRYDLDYSELAKANDLRKPYKLTAGQYLKVEFDKPKQEYVPVKKRKLVKKKINKPIDKVIKVKGWVWPTKGKIIHKFAPKKRKKGIDISGKLHQDVVSAANGRVVYSGSSLRGYGNLLIIKHNKDLFSAYAHNAKLLVREDEVVIAGQKIAYLGDDEANQPMLHFEIRLKGKPVDPLKYLPRKN